MENIHIFDNFLNEQELHIILDMIKKKMWKYGHSSGTIIEKIENKFFAGYDIGDFCNEYIKSKIENILNKQFILDRNYMHLQPYEMNGAYHIDSEKENTYSFCIYITSIENDDIENANGDFLLKIPNSDIIICINTNMNRGVFFPSTYLHKGLAYNRFYKEDRICIAWKFTEIL